jgi:hypothetical protein
MRLVFDIETCDKEVRPGTLSINDVARWILVDTVEKEN